MSSGQSDIIVNWQGASGRLYPHNVYRPWETVPPFPAVYVLVRHTADGRPVPLRIGEAGDAAARLAALRQADPALWSEADQIHLLFLGLDRRARLAAQADLRRGHPTPPERQATRLNAFLEALRLAPAEGRRLDRFTRPPMEVET